MFTSYAQNFEDVMLWRALKHVQQGFYVDIGAQDPIIDSVSRGFYEQGWRGVSVEPTSTYANKLRADRRDEVVEQCAVGKGPSELTFFEFPDTGLSTGDEEIARSQKERGYRCESTTVELIPLSQILDRYPDRDIHWLKIDTEGMEHSVLASWGSSSKRPWIVVVESTIPLEKQKTSEGWEPLLLERGYKLCYFDGLNSYYLAGHKSDLEQAFNLPPNVFDEFTLSGTSTSNMTAFMRQRASILEETVNDLACRDREATERIRQLDVALANYEKMIRTIHASFSWQITRPFRVAARVAKRSLSKTAHLGKRLLHLPKRMLRRVLTKVLDVVKADPRLRALALRTMRKHPRLLRPLTSVVRSYSLVGSPALESSFTEVHRHPTRTYGLGPADYIALSPRAKLELSRLSRIVRSQES